MNRLYIFLIGSLFLCMPLLAAGAKPGWSAFLAHAYFCNEAIMIDDAVQPDRLIYDIKGNHPGATATFVITLVLKKGKHDIAVEIISPNGKTLANNTYPTMEIKADQSTQVLTTAVNGRMPTGGLRFKVTGKYNGGKEEKLLGLFFLPTTK